MNDKSLLERVENTSFYRRLKYGINRRIVRFFEESVFIGKESLRVAEFACGSGFGAHLLAQQKAVRLSIASDINTGLFNQSSTLDFSAAFVVSDIFYPSFQTNSFDLVWNSSSLEELEKPQEALLSMANLVKPGGFVFVGVPYLVGPLALYHVTPVKRWREWLGRPYTFGELERIFAACGLSPQKRLVYFSRFFAGVLARKES